MLTGLSRFTDGSSKLRRVAVWVVKSVPRLEPYLRNVLSRASSKGPSEQPFKLEPQPEALKGWQSLLARSDGRSRRPRL